MRTIVGSVAMCVGSAAALATAFLALAWSQAAGLMVLWACIAIVLIAVSVVCFRAGPAPTTRWWLIVAPAVVGGLTGAILAVLFSDSGTVAVSNDAHRLWVRVFRTRYDLGTGPLELMQAQMLAWGTFVGVGFVAVLSAVGAVLGAIVRGRTRRCT